MRSLRKAFVALVLGLIIGQLCGCATSNLVNVWHDPSFQAPPLGKMLVIAVRKDATMRRIWEDAFTGELAKQGVAAISSYTVYPLAPPDTEQVAAAVQTDGFDGILVIFRLPTETDTRIIPGYTTTEPSVRFSSYWQRYLTHYRAIEHPGYVESQTVDIRAIDVTTTGIDGRMIWSATSRTPDPKTVMDAQRGIAGLVITELTQRRIISPKK